MALIPEYRGPLDPANIQEEAANSLRAALEMAPGLPAGLTIWCAVLGGPERVGIETLNSPDRVMLWQTDGITYATQPANIVSLRDHMTQLLPMYVEDLRRVRQHVRETVPPPPWLAK
jgi:hypothetical protein